MPYDLKVLPARLLAWRKHADMTQAQLGLKADVRQPTISDIETGRMTNPGVETLTALAHALDIDLPTLLTLNPAVRKERK